jgi:hypothetical protein
MSEPVSPSPATPEPLGNHSGTKPPQVVPGAPSHPERVRGPEPTTRRNCGRLRFAIYRDRAPFSPIYLGDVLADDHRTAQLRAEATYGGRVLVQRNAIARAASPALERALRRTVAKRDFRGGGRGGR